MKTLLCDLQMGIMEHSIGVLENGNYAPLASMTMQGLGYTMVGLCYDLGINQIVLTGDNTLRMTLKDDIHAAELNQYGRTEIKVI